MGMKVIDRPSEIPSEQLTPSAQRLVIYRVGPEPVQCLHVPLRQPEERSLRGRKKMIYGRCRNTGMFGDPVNPDIFDRTGVEQRLHGIEKEFVADNAARAGWRSRCSPV